MNLKTREDRQRHAAEHYEDIKIRLANETADSIKRTKVYSPRILLTEVQPKNEHSVRLVDLDSVSCLFRMPCEGKVCVLNYASYKHPGGYFLGGSAAQEEALCHESNLYPVLLSFDDTYYAENKKKLNRALYLDRALYSPDIVFEHDGQTKKADVLTCAAPNFRTAHTYQSVSMNDNLKVFQERIDFMYQIIEENEVDTLIAGAWGCGVFMQPPKEVCRMMISSLLEFNYKIPNIYFAIPDKASVNYRGFDKVLKSLKNV